jgi:hypothetical protein
LGLTSFGQFWTLWPPSGGAELQDIFQSGEPLPPKWLNILISLLTKMVRYQMIILRLRTGNIPAQVLAHESVQSVMQWTGDPNFISRAQLKGNSPLATLLATNKSLPAILTIATIRIGFPACVPSTALGSWSSSILQLNQSAINELPSNLIIIILHNRCNNREVFLLFMQESLNLPYR